MKRVYSHYCPELEDELQRVTRSLENELQDDRCVINELESQLQTMHANLDNSNKSVSPLPDSGQAGSMGPAALASHEVDDTLTASGDGE